MINTITLYGRAVDKPDFKTTTTNQSVANFKLAFDSVEKNEDGTKKSSYIKCTARNKCAEIVEKNVQKGTALVIQGSITQKLFQRKDGSNASEIYITVWEIVVLKSQDSYAQLVNLEEDDVPF